MEDYIFIQKERDRQIMEIVRHFLLAVVTFRQQYQNYKQGSLHFADLAKLVDDRGQSLLYALKELSHTLYRRTPAIISEREQIFDLTIGSIFHLAMKIREDLYQLEIYGPKYRALVEKGDYPPHQENLIRQFQGILSRAENSFQEGMEEIAVLTKDVFRQFKELLLEYRENGLLIRFFLEETNLLQEVMGKEALKKLFRTLYGLDEAQPYRLAGESYFRSAFYNKAIQTFSQALEISPGDESLQFKIYLSQGMEQFYAFDPLQALNFFEKCLSLAGKVEFLEIYRAMIGKVCQKIQEEFPGRRKSDQHRDLVKKAQSLQRQLEELPPAPSDIYPT
jgi:tetratricopeptide (TPR) repeat protein